jgi:protoporphyrin/coproporphyrin ferrochelatase
MKRALLLMNMGGPNNLSEVEMFLNNMFNDKRIISAPKLIRVLIAKLITWKRKNSAIENYKTLGGKSPIVGYTNQLISRLQECVDADVYMVMRYTPPSASSLVEQLQKITHTTQILQHFLVWMIFIRLYKITELKQK